MSDKNINTEFPIKAYELLFNYMKHISLLSTGSILIVLAFIEKLFIDPNFKTYALVSFISFLVSTGMSLFAQWGVIDLIDDGKKISNRVKIATIVFIILTLISFMIGLISLVFFIFKNI